MHIHRMAGSRFREAGSKDLCLARDIHTHTHARTDRNTQTFICMNI